MKQKQAGLRRRLLINRCADCATRVLCDARARHGATSGVAAVNAAGAEQVA
jgi:hypothetical protein